MPHKCTKCETVFEDGAEVILNGCPNCGWNKFLYVSNESGKETDEVEKGSETTKEVTEEKEKTIPCEEYIHEVDEFIGIEHKESTVIEDDGEKVESVRIIGPGSYELNLDSLLERDEIIMAIKENGTYAVDLASTFHGKRKKK